MQVYPQVEGTQNIISNLVNNIYNDTAYQTYLKALESSDIPDKKRKANIIRNTIIDIRVFNTNTEPLFLARDIGILMGITHINAAIKNYNDTEKILGYVMYGGKIKQKNLLTRRGVYRILLNSRTKLSEVFRGFVYLLLDHMMLHEIDKLKGLMAQYTLENPEQVKQSLIELHENMNKYKLLYERECAERQLWMEKAEEAHEKNTRLDQEKAEAEIQNMYDEMLITQLNAEKTAYQRRLKSIDQIDDEEVLVALKKRFLKSIYIYAVAPPAIEKIIRGLNKKKSEGLKAEVKEMGLNVEDLEENHLIDPTYETEYKLNIIEFEAEPSLISDSILYLNICWKKRPISEKYILIADEWVADKSEYQKLIGKLSEECEAIDPKKPGEMIFLTSINFVRDVAREILLGPAGNF